MCINDKKRYDKKSGFDFDTSARSLRRIRAEFERRWKSGFFTNYVLDEHTKISRE
jgi:hypothetical protein